MSIIANLKFHIFESSPSISQCLITISIKTCSFTIFNSVILLNLMSDSPVLIPQSLFPHIISTIIEVEDNTSYGTSKIKIKLKTNWWFSHYYEKDVHHIESSVLFRSWYICRKSRCIRKKTYLYLNCCFFFSVNCSFDNNFSL